MGHYVYVRTKKVPGKPGMWPEKKKMEVVTTYLSTGSIALTSSMCNVPQDTIFYWKRQEWWKEIVDQAREDDNTELDSRLTKVLDKSLSAVTDRLENGEYSVNPKTGKVTRIPPKLRDVHKVSTDLIEKRMLLRKKTSVQKENTETTENRLLKLAETFAKIAIGKDVKEVKEVYEGEFNNIPESVANAIHDQREAGLQKRTELGA